jgi:hypothetical protein
MKETMIIEGVPHEITEGKASVLAAIPPGQCEGNACGDVTIQSLGTGNGYLLKNDGAKRVRLSIRWAFGFQCMDWSDTDLGPGESKRMANWAYCNPVRANYI